MKNPIRRLFPKHPALGLALMCVVALEVVLVAHAAVPKKGFAKEGYWHSFYVNGTCYWNHDADTVTASNTQWHTVMPNGHYAKCNVATSGGCPSYSPTPEQCSASNNGNPPSQTHYEPFTWPDL